ncbi:putative transporter [Xylariaceae sp. FL0016]|nr:putative transporter [Xylariaceae sp. FL0016]
MTFLAGAKQTPLVREMTPRLFGVFFFMSIGAVNFGFDNAWWNCVLPLSQFIEYYGPPGATALPATWQSAGSGIGTGGMVIGCCIGSAIGKKIGRKWTIVVLVCIAIVGMVIQNAIHSFWAVIVGRMINSISMGIEANVIPTFMGELAPPAIRGSLVNFYQWWQMIGVLISTGLVYACSNIYADQWAFRVVMIVQFFIPLILLVMVYFMPESPRWLLMHRRREDAFKAMKFIRHGSSATDADLNGELDLIMLSIEEQEENHHATTYADCFKGSNGRRTMIAACCQVAQQLQGNSFASSYGVLFLKQLGIPNALQAQTAKVACALLGATIAFYAADRFGRRPLMMICAVGMWVTMWTASGISSFWPGELSEGPAASVALACMLLWTLFGTLGWGSCNWMTTAEIGTNQLREKTVGIATTSSFLIVLLVSFINPFVQSEPGNLQQRVGFVYGSFSVIAVVFVFFFVPELKGRSLEELDEMFQAGVPARKFRDYRTEGIGARITALQDGAHIDTKVVDAVEVVSIKDRDVDATTQQPKTVDV